MSESHTDNITSLFFEQPKPSHSPRLALQNPICSECHFCGFSLSDFHIGNLAIYDGDPHTDNWSLSGADLKFDFHCKQDCKVQQ